MERDSQVTASPDSLSLVSEPPDVRHWFSSYVYESPVLGTAEDFGDSILKESEILNLWRVFGNGRQQNVVAVRKFEDAGDVDQWNGDKKGALDFGRSYGTSGGNKNGEESLTESPDSSQSGLPASEQGDIRQKFDRDVYPSPGLHGEFAALISQGNDCKGKYCVAAMTDDGQKDSEAKEEKSTVSTRSREELSSEVVKRDGSAKDHDPDKYEHSSEFAGYSSSSLLLSEPPHISNWFSSYVYESPELDTLRDFGSIENVDAYTSKLMPPTIWSPREVNNELKENINLPSDVLVGGVVTKVNSESNALALSDNLRAKNEVLSLKGSGSCLNPEKEISRYPAGSSYGRNHRKRLSGANFQSDAVSPASTRDNPGLCTVNQASDITPNGRISETENLEPCTLCAGFVSLRKKSVVALGPSRKPQEVALNRCLYAKRTPLVETTNLPTQHEDAVEHAGKWKCPQKSKTRVGPPMKQLRLERWDLEIPTLAVIEGVALGGGFELALACDLRICGEDAILGLPEAGLATIPATGGTQRLPRIVGKSVAKELIYTGRKISGKDARLMGLVNHSMPTSEALSKALEIAREMNQKGPLALRMAKRAVNRGNELDMQSALKTEEECYVRKLDTKVRLEGVAAFAEKRKSRYTGE